MVEKFSTETDYLCDKISKSETKNCSYLVEDELPPASLGVLNNSSIAISVLLRYVRLG
uniref:Uncharacterized protein n=1 Tax=Nelumbo nucifera TaxID=4432 RepID=A0A822ZB70_NELNU|nr:TPA_asm: hypothetical protein HUJ06_000397 [Nelumbo nucifera]